jgi:hypothetical protein
VSEEVQRKDGGKDETKKRENKSRLERKRREAFRASATLGTELTSISSAGTTSGNNVDRSRSTSETMEEKEEGGE